MADRLACTNDPLAISSDSLTEKVSEFCNTVLDCHVQASDISTAHTLPSRDENTPFNMMVRFKLRSIRDDICSARYKLKNFTMLATNNKVLINEDLTTLNRKILATLRRKVRNKIIAKAYPQPRKIFARDIRGGKKPISSIALMLSPFINV